MPDYYMPPNRPCPSCRGSHLFKDAAPDREAGEGVTFQVTCPVTGATVEVEVPAAASETRTSVDTGIKCPTCLKATYAVVGARSQGNISIETLRCQNPGCEHEYTRRNP